MGKAKIVFGSILIIAGAVTLFFSLPLGIIFFSAGVSAIVYHKDEDTIEERKDLKRVKDKL